MPHLSDFAATPWRLARRIDDRRAGAAGAFHGTATLRPQGDALLYREAGTLRLGDGPVLRAERAYLWLPAGDRIEVRFADGRPFHAFTPAGRAPGTDHPCGADLYRVLYDFTAWPVWTAEWTVAGPAKDYVLASRYEPDSGRPPSPPEDSPDFDGAPPGPRP